MSSNYNQNLENNINANNRLSNNNLNKELVFQNYANSFNDNILKSTLKGLNTFIVKKKLTLNGIWTSKISQEDPYSIFPLENTNENLILMNILFNSILVFSKKINEYLILLLNPEIKDSTSDEYVCLISAYSRSLIAKIKNFRDIKTKSFKLSKESLFEIKNLKDQFNLFDIQEGSKLISDITSFLSEFYEELKKHLST